MIKLLNVDKYFNKFKKNKIHVIDNTSLEINEAGLVALLGPSGSGKTTLLNTIGGLDKIGKGSIYINNKKITQRPQFIVDKIRTLNIGYIFQDYKLIEDLSVYDNVALALKLIGIKDKKEIEQRVTYILDRVGMLRYKKRPCNMLSGGERQRVGIARALVKNPNIIIADEPTGNLDSKNSLEIMNIIKAISKEKLVILVTHEKNLAKFYASRIIEIADGKIINDYQNTDANELDYEMNNVLYLKDYKNKYEYDKNIKIYSDSDNDLKLNIVVHKNNIYIKSLDNRKIEVIDETSSIEMLDSKRQTISKKDVEKYSFDYSKIINDDKKLKYSSIFNPINFITNGFQKVINYSLVKKILLIGFFISAIFATYAFSSIFRSLEIKEEDFINLNKEYLIIETKKIKYNDFKKYEDTLDSEYLLPGNSSTTINVKTANYYQQTLHETSITGSIFTIDNITEDKIIIGRMPEQINEIVVDKLVLKKCLDQSITKMLGYSKIEQFIDEELSIDNMDNLKIVGIVDLKDPSIYMDKDLFINVLYHTKNNNNNNNNMFYLKEENTYEYDDYNLYLEKIVLKEGRLPSNDYETIVNYELKDTYKLNKEIDKKINNKKLKVVGYYTSKEDIKIFLVNVNTIKMELVSQSENIAVYSKNKEATLKKAVSNYKLNIKDSYASSRDTYIKSKKESRKTTIISAGIILAISLIEIFLMIRSSFLSRLKEVGTYRAIGVKKKDIYIMFSGEIIAITVMASIPGILFAAYIINILTKIKILQEYLIINPFIILFTILFVLIFNLVVGLMPIFNVIRKRPAEILSRTDI